MKRPAGWVQLVEKATGYTYSAALRMVSSRGVKSSECSLDDIVAIVKATLVERQLRAKRKTGVVLRANDGRLRYIEHKGERATLAEWARRARIPSLLLTNRIVRLGVETAIARSLAEPGPWPLGRRSPRGAWSAA